MGCHADRIRDPSMPAPIWRGFGQRVDLDLDFSGTDQPDLVTRVLSACNEGGAGPVLFWSLTLAERIGALASIVKSTEGSDALELGPNCAACGEALELSVPYAALLHEAERVRNEPTVDAPLGPARSVCLRRPTGEDQRAWRARAYQTAEEAIATIVAALTVSGGEPTALDGAELERLSRAMEAFDPLICFQITFVCPGCGAESTLPVDLEATLLARLRARHEGLLEEVHRLAVAYGWTEEEALAIPARRRERYLRLIAEEGAKR